MTPGNIIVRQKKGGKICERADLNWDGTCEMIVIETKVSEFDEEADSRRDGSIQLVVPEVEHGERREGWEVEGIKISNYTHVV